MSRLFFTESVELDEEATTQLQQENAVAIVQAIQDKITQQRDQPLTSDAAKAIINSAMKETNVKKGLVMRSLRAALMGTMHGAI